MKGEKADQRITKFSVAMLSPQTSQRTSPHTHELVSHISFSAFSMSIIQSLHLLVAIVVSSSHGLGDMGALHILRHTEESACHAENESCGVGYPDCCEGFDCEWASFHVRRCTKAPDYSLIPCIYNQAGVEVAVQQGGTHFLCASSMVKIKTPVTITSSTSVKFECEATNCVITSASSFNGTLFETEDVGDTASTHSLVFKNVSFKNARGSGSMIKLRGGHTSFSGGIGVDNECIIQGNQYSESLISVDDGILTFDTCSIRSNKVKNAPFDIIDIHRSTLLLKDTFIVNNTAEGDELLSIDDDSICNITNTDISHNTVNHDIIDVDHGSIVALDGVTLRNNVCERVLESQGKSLLRLESVDVSENTCQGEGRGHVLFAMNESYLSLKNVSFCKNKVSDDLVQIGDGSEMTSNGFRVAENHVQDELIVVTSSRMELRTTEIINNTSIGDTIDAVESNIELHDTKILGNHCDDLLESNATNWLLDNVELSDNKSEDDLVDVGYRTVMEMHQVIFSRNENEDLIGIHRGSNVKMEHCKISDNISEQEVIDIFRDSTLDMMHTQVTNNKCFHVLEVDDPKSVADIKHSVLIGNIANDVLVDARDSASLSLMKVNIVGNVAKDGTLATIWARNSAVITIKQSLFKSNSASFDVSIDSTSAKSTVSCDKKTHFCDNVANRVSEKAAGCIVSESKHTDCSSV